MVSQKISEDDIEYITDSLIPLLEKILEKDETDEGLKNGESLEMLKPLLAKETFNILQLLGFNFKKAIGEPLTLLINKLISAQIPETAEQSKELEILIAQRELEYFRILQDEESFDRLMQLNQE